VLSSGRAGRAEPPAAVAEAATTQARAGRCGAAGHRV